MSKKIDVSVVRDAITKLVSLLTDRNITVTQRGMKAYVEYTPSGKIKKMNIPYLPDNASEDFIAAVQGFVDHEVGHVLHTDPAIIKKSAAKGATFAGMQNIIEDTYIERMMQQTFYGSKNTLDAVRKFHIEKISAPKIDEAIANGDSATATAYLIVLVFRAWAGQRIAKEYVNSTPELSRLTAEVEKRVGMDLLAKLGTLESSKDCYDLTALVLKNMAPPAPPAPPSPKSKGKSEPTNDDGENEPEQPPEPEDGEGEEGDDDTSTSSAPSEPEGDDESSSGTAPGDDEPTDPDQDESKSSSSAEGEPKDDDDEGGDGIGGEVTETTEEQDDQDSESRGAAKGDADDQDKESEGPAPSTPADPSDAEKPDAPSDSETEPDGDEVTDHGNPGETGESGDDDTPVEAGEGTDLSLDEIFDKFVDFDDAVSEGLGKEAEVQNSKLVAPVFTNEFDTIGTFEFSASEERTKALIEKITPMVAPMAKSLQRALAAKDKVTWNPGQRKGRINAGSLYRSATGDDRVFRTRYETKAKNTVVSLLVDCSGSMNSDGRIYAAFQAAFALSSTLDRLKIAHEVIGFTTTKHRRTELKRAARALGGETYYPRGEPIYMPVFKGFEERLGFVQQARIAYMTTHSATSLLRENVDGECLRIAAARIRRQKAERRIIMVLSDGQPSCADMGLHTRETLMEHYNLAGKQWPLAADLKLAVKETTDSGVDVVGIGIQHPGVSEFYPKSVNLSAVNKLPTLVMDQLTKLLLS